MHTARLVYHISYTCWRKMAKLLQRSVCMTVIVLAHIVAATPESYQGRSVRQAHEHDGGDHFSEVGNYLVDAELTNTKNERDFETNHGQNITFEETRLLVETIFQRVDCDRRVTNCSKCQVDFTSDVFAYLSLEPELGLDEGAFIQASPLLLYGTYDLVAICQAGAGGTNLSEDAVTMKLKSAGADGTTDVMTESDLGAILTSINESYTAVSYAQCFDVESVFDESVSDHEAGALDDEIRLASEAVVAGLLQGHCIGEPTMPMTTSFTDAIFGAYATSGVITEEAFEDMLIGLGIGGPPHDHDHDHAHAHDSATRRRRGATMDIGSLKMTSAVKKYRTVANRPGRVITAAVEDDHDHDHDHTALVPNVNESCFTGEELLTIFGIDHEAGITETEFNELSPSLVQQILSGSCLEDVTTPTSITAAQTWGYGTLAVAIISMMAVLGGLFVPCMSEGVYEQTIQLMIALAVATLSADAILHLLPQALGLHSHDGEGAHGPTSPELAYIWKCFVVEIAIYVFFVFEQISTFTSCCTHSHSHDNAVADVEMANSKTIRTRSLSERSSLKKHDSKVARTVSTKELTEAEGGSFEVEGPTNARGIRGCNSVASMVILGDSLHNFADGLAIGAAFTLSISAGLSTSIAVFCHELPHELGDLAVLLNQGMSLPVALLLNLMCACMAFIGLWVGIPLGQTEMAREWIFAVVAGMFIYVALADMLPMLLNYKGKTSRLRIVILQNFGFLLGIGIMLIIALYEDAIAFTI